MKLTDGITDEECLLTPPDTPSTEDIPHYRMVAYLSGDGILCVRMDTRRNGSWHLEDRLVLDRAERDALGDFINVIRGKAL